MARFMLTGDVSYARGLGCTVRVNNVVKTGSAFLVAGNILEISAGVGDIFESVTITTPSGYIGGIYNEGGVETFALSYGDTVATYTATNSTEVTDFTITLKSAPNTDFVNDDDLLVATEKHVKIVVDGVEITENTKIATNTLIELYALDGWKFGSVSQDIYWYANNGLLDGFVISEDLTKCVRQPESRPMVHLSDIIGLDLIQSSTDIVGGANNVYLMDNSNLSELAQDVLYSRFSDGQGGTVDIDYSQFVINLMMIPFEIPASNILEEQKIRLADKITTTDAHVINTDLVKIPLGDIFTPATEGNVLDYSNTVAIMHLPFVEPFIIDLPYVIGETLTIHFEIDVYSGLGTYRVASSKINDNIYSSKVNLGVTVPFVNVVGFSAQQIFPSNISVGGDNNVRVPFIELLNSNSPLAKEIFSTPIKATGKLINETGFVTIDNINIENVEYKNELEIIKSVLSNGVKIK